MAAGGVVTVAGLDMAAREADEHRISRSLHCRSPAWQARTLLMQRAPDVFHQRRVMKCRAGTKRAAKCFALKRRAPKFHQLAVAVLLQVSDIQTQNDKGQRIARLVDKAMFHPGREQKEIIAVKLDRLTGKFKPSAADRHPANFMKRPHAHAHFKACGVMALDHPHLTRRHIDLGRRDTAGGRQVRTLHCRIIQSANDESSKKFSAGRIVWESRIGSEPFVKNTAMDLIYQSEKWLKEKMFGCQTCGQCILSHTSLICPMNCPKGLRNGPCGGTLDGKCEVIPEIDCVWTRIETKKKNKTFGIHLPPREDLLNTASYVNLFNGKDRETRLPHEFVDTRHIPASSHLATKMARGEFVVTLEIASPRDSTGLPRVEKIMQRVATQVDAVNTTTNAGGVPSLHSTETGKLVAAHGVESIIQFCGRDHDQDDFLREIEKAMEMGYRNFLLLTGDWLPQTDRKVAQQTWFPMDSSQMIHFANQRIEEWRDRLSIVPFIGCAANPFSIPMPISVDRLAAPGCGAAPC